MNILIFTSLTNSVGFGRYAGPYRVATELRQAGFTVQVVDFFTEMSSKEIEDVIDHFVAKDTLFVGFSTTMLRKEKFRQWEKSNLADECDDPDNFRVFPQSDEFMQNVFARIKSRNSNCKIVVGGYRAIESEYPGVDIFLWGFADKSAVSLARDLKADRPIEGEEYKGAYLIDGKDHQFEGFSKSQIVWHESDGILKGEHLPLELSRGCVFRCSFCAFEKRKKGEGTKDIASLRDELIRNYELFGTQGYMFCDNTFNDSLQKVEEMHSLFTSLPFELEWSAYIRPDTIHRHPEMASLMAESGLVSAFLGIESFHPHATKMIGKSLSAEKVRETLMFVKEKWGQDVNLCAGFIFGLPGETLEYMEQTLNWLTSDESPLHCFDVNTLYVESCNPELEGSYEYSQISRNPKKFGYELHGDGTWHTDDLSYEQVDRLVDEFRHDTSRWNKSRKRPNFMQYNQLRNLGFSKEQVFSYGAPLTRGQFFDEARQRKNKLKQDYLEKLLT